MALIYNEDVGGYVNEAGSSYTQAEYDAEYGPDSGNTGGAAAGGRSSGGGGGFFSGVGDFLSKATGTSLDAYRTVTGKPGAQTKPAPQSAKQPAWLKWVLIGGGVLLLLAVVGLVFKKGK